MKGGRSLEVSSTKTTHNGGRSTFQKEMRLQFVTEWGKAAAKQDKYVLLSFN